MQRLNNREHLVLGVECGATRTVALVADSSNNLVERIEGPAANARLLTDDQLSAHFKQLAAKCPKPAAVGIGMAGVRSADDRRRVASAASFAWPDVPCWVGNDLETALEAAGNSRSETTVTRVILISGTGSCSYGRNPRGQTAKVGGWGHLLGDQGSGYDIAMDAMRAVVQQYDRTGQWPRLGQALLRAIMLNGPEDLIGWVHQASKPDVAALAKEVFAAAALGDRIARQVLGRASMRLADTAAACARRLSKQGQPLEFVFVGGVLKNQPQFARRVANLLREKWPGARTRQLQREGAWGAVAKALKLATQPGSSTASPHQIKSATSPVMAFPVPAATGPSPTEQRNPRSMQLDKLSTEAAVRLMLAEDVRIPTAVLKKRRSIARAVTMVANALKHGGRLFYVGAGTSGRLGVLDASECPPTFSVPPDMVQAIIAGGQRAIWSSVEGAEDDAFAGAEAVRFRGVTDKDVVIGIAASGRTPFVWGALHAARRAGAATILICFNPRLRFDRTTRPDLVIDPEVGPEILTGSTRLKAGTATKLVLNIISTLAMVRLGKVISNLMVDVNPANTKLRDRAARILEELTGLDYEKAREALEKSGWNVRRALQVCSARRDGVPSLERTHLSRRDHSIAAAPR